MTVELCRTVMDNELDGMVWTRLLQLAQIGEALTCKLSYEGPAHGHPHLKLLLKIPT